MLLIEAELRESAIHGIGLFCREFIPKGTRVWEFHPLFDVVLDEKVVQTLPSSMHTFMKMYAYRSVQTGELIVNMDLSRHMNHSDQPNLLSDAESNYYAREDIAPGTELTCDYREFALDGCSDFLG